MMFSWIAWILLFLNRSRKPHFITDLTKKTKAHPKGHHAHTKRRLCSEPQTPLSITEQNPAA